MKINSCCQEYYQEMSIRFLDESNTLDRKLFALADLLSCSKVTMSQKQTVTYLGEQVMDYLYRRAALDNYFFGRDISSPFDDAEILIAETSRLKTKYKKEGDHETDEHDSD